MAVAFTDFSFSIGRSSQAARLQDAGTGAQPHGAAQVGMLVPVLGFSGTAVDPFGHQVDDRIDGIGVEFHRMCACDAGQIAGDFHHRELHAQADAEKGQTLFTGIGHGMNLALHAAAAETAGCENPVAAFEPHAVPLTKQQVRDCYYF